MARLIGKMERVAVPASAIRTLLSGLVLPGGDMNSLAHFDDDDEWVYSRCILADFSGLGDEEASRLSAEGRLCCWASVVLTRVNGDDGRSQWDVGLVVHRVLERRTAVGRCGCL